MNPTKTFPHRRDDLDGHAHCRCGVMAVHDPKLGETWGRNCPAALREALEAARRERVLSRRGTERARRQRDAQVRLTNDLVARVAELEATLANERGEGEPPVPGWRTRRRAGEARWVLHNERPGRVLDVVRQMSDTPRTIVSHWWDREVDADGTVIMTHSEGEARTMRAAMLAASEALAARSSSGGAP